MILIFRYIIILIASTFLFSLDNTHFVQSEKTSNKATITFINQDVKTIKSGKYDKFINYVKIFIWNQY